MKLLITTRSDEKINEISSISHPVLKAYAKRVGADFMILDHVPESDSGDGLPHYRIMKHYELHEEYDRILHIDSDMILSRDCPDVFKLVPYDKIASVFEDEGSRRAHRRNLIARIQQKFGSVGWNSGYINTGFFLTSKCHRDIYQPIDGEYWKEFGSDDVHLAYLIHKYNYEIMPLSFRFNHMTMFSEPWNSNANRFNSYVIHYGGAGVFDRGVKNKIDQMRRDYDRIYNNKLKILFVGVFDKTKKSTNTSQLLALNKLGHSVVGYNYRARATRDGPAERDKHLVQTVKEDNYDLVVYSKCNQVSFGAFKEINNETKTCLWFMDPLVTYDNEMRMKTSLVDYFCCDKQNVLDDAEQINSSSYLVCEGYDQEVDKIIDNVDKDYDVSFIGNIYGARADKIQQIKKQVKIISRAYGAEHAMAVAKSKINLNFCTTDGASDRIYKIMAAGGFLLTDDWAGRVKHFEDGKDLVIFKDIDDLNDKIDYYLKNTDKAVEIALQGTKTVEKFNRLSWAQKITNLALEETKQT